MKPWPPSGHRRRPRYESVDGCTCEWCEFARKCKLTQAKVDARTVDDLKKRGIL